MSDERKYGNCFNCSSGLIEVINIGNAFKGEFNLRSMLNANGTQITCWNCKKYNAISPDLVESFANERERLVSLAQHIASYRRLAKQTPMEMFAGSKDKSKKEFEEKFYVDPYDFVYAVHRDVMSRSVAEMLTSKDIHINTETGEKFMRTELYVFTAEDFKVFLNSFLDSIDELKSR